MLRSQSRYGTHSHIAPALTDVCTGGLARTSCVVQVGPCLRKEPCPKTIPFSNRSWWGLLAASQPRGVRGQRESGGLHRRHQDLRGGLRHGSHPVRLHHLQNQPGEDQGNYEEVWEAAGQPVPAAAPAAGSAVAAAEIGLGSASISPAVAVVRVM